MSQQDATTQFTDHPFGEPVLRDIEAAGFQTPTPIQAQCMGPILEGKDVIGLAQTGTGKTAAFALPIIHRLARGVEMGALVLAPTRELAQQITAMFEELGASSGVRVATVFGGVKLIEDLKALQSWPNVLVATPGRLIDHIEQGNVDFSDIQVLVVDEADRMHDMGFIPQIRRIIEELPTERQTLMFTATMPSDVEHIARRHMRDPIRVQVGRRSAPAERAKQQLFRLHDNDKTPTLLRLLEQSEGRVLVFVRTKRGVDRVYRVLKARGQNVARLHSDRAQTERDDAMAGFRDGKYRVLVATDIAARGLDVEKIEHVINYDFPQHPEDYVHRIGRTARVAATGLATSFVTRSDGRHVAAVERLIGEKLPIQRAPGTDRDEPHTKSRRKRSRRRRPRGRGKRGGSSKSKTPAASKS